MNTKTCQKKIWLITGCSTGFGRVLAEELLKSDAQIIATARNTKDLAGLESDRSLLLPLDVTQPQAIEQAVAQTMERFGHIDVLVNNAGYGMIGAVEESMMDAARRMFETNVFGLIGLTQAVLPIMRGQRSGHIINMSSVAGVCPTPGFSMYNATKYAVEGVSESLALEVKHLGIHVTLVEPGPFRTDFASRSLDVQAPMEDYARSVGKTRQYLKDINGTQPGDPLKAAHILMEITNKPNPPLHLPLGNMAFDRITAKWQSWQKELAELEPIARSADFTS